MNPYNNTFDILPDEVATKIVYYVGKEYLGIGAVNRRLNKIFKDSDIPNKTIYGGYASLKEMIDKFDSEYDYNKEDHYEAHGDYPDICSHIATGIAYYDRNDLLEWVIEKKKNKIMCFKILYKASQHGKLNILRTIFGILGKEARNNYNGSESFNNCTMIAEKHGHLECLLYLHDVGFNWGEYACNFAATFRILERLSSE